MKSNAKLVPHADEADTFFTQEKEVACDGGKLGHPKVFLEVGQNQAVVCPYCSRKFIHQISK